MLHGNHGIPESLDEDDPKAAMVKASTQLFEWRAECSSQYYEDILTVGEAVSVMIVSFEALPLLSCVSSSCRLLSRSEEGSQGRSELF